MVSYANMRGVRALDHIVDLCQRELAFIWLTKRQKLQRILKGKKLMGESPGCIELSVYAPPTKGWTHHTQPQEIAN